MLWLIWVSYVVVLVTGDLTSVFFLTEHNSATNVSSVRHLVVNKGTVTRINDKVSACKARIFK